MKRLTIACIALAAFSAPALAGGATYELKAGDGDYTGTNVDALTGNPVAYYSSDATGNGGVVGGNGSAWNGAASPDQTTSPGSRANAVQELLATVGKGRNK
jgi:hypothetical protein